MKTEKMDEKIMNQFEVETVEPLLQQVMEILEKEYIEKRETWKNEFLEFVATKVLPKMKELGEREDFHPSYLSFHMLRTRLLRHEYQYSVDLYGDKWFLEEEIRLADWNVDFIFSHFEFLWKQLSRIGKRYFGKMEEAELNCIMMLVAESFNDYLVKLLRYARNELIELPLYQEVKKGDTFLIQCGEYFDFCEFVHREVIGKEEKSLKKMVLNREDEQTYPFRDFRYMDFSDVEFNEYCFQYVDFSHCLLENTTFTKCDLTGARFCHADLSTTKFIKCNLTDAYGLEDWGSINGQE